MGGGMGRRIDGGGGGWGEEGGASQTLIQYESKGQGRWDCTNQTFKFSQSKNIIFFLNSAKICLVIILTLVAQCTKERKHTCLRENMHD